MQRLLVISDVHGNLTALERILQEEPAERFAGILLLGDLIDYGPRSNEVIRRIQELPSELVLANLWGNHERAIAEQDYTRFSSRRGSLCAEHTRRSLTEESLRYIETSMDREGMREFTLGGRRCLAVHGSLEDVYWKSIPHGEQGEAYAAYDLVFSGHSHIPHFFEHFYPANCSAICSAICAADRAAYRDRKRTVFLNPGSVGQPRNHTPGAHYAVVETDTLSVQLKSIPYDVEREIALFSDEVDAFYKERLRLGI